MEGVWRESENAGIVFATYSQENVVFASPIQNTVAMRYFTRNVQTYHSLHIVEPFKRYGGCATKSISLIPLMFTRMDDHVGL